MNKEKLLSIINKYVGYAEQEIYDAVTEYEEEKISFAKKHCEAALKAANLNVKLLVDNNEEYREPGEGEDLVDYYQCGSDTVYVSSASILEAYPLTNIK